MQAKHFHIDNFDGPLDLLLYLIQKNEVNIYDIPISQITTQYLDIVSLHTKINLDDASEFYLFASTLLYIKSRILLPEEVEPSLEIEDPRRELVDQLIEYQKIKKLTQLLHSSLIDIQIERNLPQIPISNEQDELEFFSAHDLLSIYSGIISKLMPNKLFNAFEKISINEKIILIQEKMQNTHEILFYDLIKDTESALEMICSFFAVLELVKNNIIVVFQKKLFSDIIIKNPEYSQRKIEDEQ